MAKKAEIEKPIVTVEPQHVQQMIHVIRGERVILDRDLAKLYGVETKNLKRQVKRNIERFPSDFMIELTREEYNSLRCQNGTIEVEKLRNYVEDILRDQNDTNDMVGAQMEAINESLAELAVKVDSLTKTKQEPRKRIGF